MVLYAKYGLNIQKRFINVYMIYDLLEACCNLQGAKDHVELEDKCKFFFFFVLVEVVIHWELNSRNCEISIQIQFFNSVIFSYSLALY
jgi:hypothetical protein